MVPTIRKKKKGNPSPNRTTVVNMRTGNKQKVTRGHSKGWY